METGSLGMHARAEGGKRTVTDLRVIPWYVPVVSILNSPVSETWKIRIHP